MAIPAVGSKVSVAFYGTVVRRKEVEAATGALISVPFTGDYDEDGFFGVMDSEGIIHIVWSSEYRIGSDQVYTVTEPADPEGWPVQLGDIWVVPNDNPLAKGTEYCVMKDDAGEDLFVCSIDCSDDFYTGDLNLFFKELNPKLVRRRG